MKLSRQEYWNGLSFPSPGNLPNPGIEHGSPALQADSLVSGKKPLNTLSHIHFLSFNIPTIQKNNFLGTYFIPSTVINVVQVFTLNFTIYVVGIFIIIGTINTHFIVEENEAKQD